MSPQGAFLTPFPAKPYLIGPGFVESSSGDRIPFTSLAGAHVAFRFWWIFPCWDAIADGLILATTINPFRAWLFWYWWPEYCQFLNGLVEKREQFARLKKFSDSANGCPDAYLTTRDLELAKTAWTFLSASGERVIADLPRILGVKRLIQPTESARSEINDVFLDAEKTKWSKFLNEDVGEYPLTEEQRRVVLENDHRVQVVAAAGSGKTSVVVGKVGYLVESGFAKPSEILILAFNKQAAAEVSERIMNGLDICPDVKTFHSLGLGLIGDITGKKPRLHKAVESDKLREFIAEILLRLAEGGAWPLISRVLALDQARGTDLIATLTDAATVREKSDSERMKSPQEEELCGLFDFLKRAGVIATWEYEADYELDTRDRKHGQYRPDFTITLPGVLRPISGEGLGGLSPSRLNEIAGLFLIIDYYKGELRFNYWYHEHRFTLDQVREWVNQYEIFLKEEIEALLD